MLRLGLSAKRLFFKSGLRSFASKTPGYSLQYDNINPDVKSAEYAVRGAIVIKAGELEAKLSQPNHGLPFDEMVYCNIGNPQSLQQQPISFNRQVLGLAMNKEILENKTVTKEYPADVVARANSYVQGSGGLVGPYTHSKGLSFVRESVAKFISERDGVPADPENIYLGNGASECVSHMLTLMMRGSKDGVFIPIPQYPLYSASLSLMGANLVPYYLNEDKEWSFDVSELSTQLATAREKGIDVRGMVVINPGNPTGQVLDRANMDEIVSFCHEQKLTLLADEVYQENIYGDKPFVSFRKVLAEHPTAKNELELVSFHSVSKGFIGECGARGGYMELVNFNEEVADEVYKLSSLSLCSNVGGQLAMDLMVNPPKEGEESYALYKEERDTILASLKRRANKLSTMYNSLPNMSCNPAEGAMYLFPKLELPAKAIAEAEAQGVAPDALYSMELLLNTGIVVVPGSGFEQFPGTFHFRTTFLPPEASLDGMIGRFTEFHNNFINKYQ
jgi:alanine transaminase